MFITKTCFACALFNKNKRRLIRSSRAERSDSRHSEFRHEHAFSFYLYPVRLRLRMLRNFVSFFGDVATRRVVSRISSSHVTWLAGDITIPFILPLMPTVTHIFPQPQHFPEYRGRRFTKLFFSFGRAHTNTVMLRLFDNRISRSSRVVNTNCRSVIGFFERVVGSSWLPRRTTYPELRLWQTSGTHPRRILENPRACLLHATYTQAGITDSRCRHDVDLGLGISSYRRSRAMRDSRASACTCVT